MGRYTFFNDFFKTDIMNHVEVLKEMMKLGGEDDRLLVPALVNLARGRIEQEKITPVYPMKLAGEDDRLLGPALVNLSRGRIEQEKITPFYPGHRPMPKNVIRMVEVNGLMQKLRGYDFNVYECCCLDPNPTLLATSLFTVLIQILLFVVLVWYHFSIHKTLVWSSDVFVTIITFATTVFFSKLVYGQYKGASNFNSVLSRVGDQSPIHQTLRLVNISVNGFLGLLTVIFNFSFLLTSENPNEAILNGLALFFVLKLDDTLKPDWDDTRIDDEIGTNIHDYIMEGDEDVKVDLKYESIDADSLLDSDDKVYIERVDGGIHIHRRSDSLHYERLEFAVSGEDAELFLENIDAFYCLQKYHDIHD